MKRRLGAHAPLSLSAWLRYDAVMRLLPAKIETVLEIGAGLGSFGAMLAERYEYVGLEPDLQSYEVAAERIGDAGRVLFETVEEFQPDHQFDLVCAFEVLEHVEEDRVVLAEWLRLVRPGGYVLLSVPLRRDGYGAWDRKAGHYRRYDRGDIVGVMESVGLQSVETFAYGFPLGRLLEVARNVVASRERADERSMVERTAKSGRQIQPPAWAGAMTRAVSAPFRAVQGAFSGTELGTGIVARGRI